MRGSLYLSTLSTVRYGRGCARPGLPGVYTRVSYYMDWINTIIPSDLSTTTTTTTNTTTKRATEVQSSSTDPQTTTVGVNNTAASSKISMYYILLIAAFLFNSIKTINFPFFIVF